MIRFLIIALMLFLYLLLGIPVLLVEWIIGKFNQEAKDYSCLRMVQTAFKLMLKVAGVRLTGRKRTQGSGGPLHRKPPQLF